MANLDNPHGLEYVGMDGPGIEWHQVFTKVVGLGTAIFKNDACQRVSGGAIEAGGTPGTTFITGVSRVYSAASTADTNVVLNVSSMALYEAQDNKATNGIVAADLGLNANLEYNAGSTTTQISGHEINETGTAVTNTLDVHLIEFLDVPDNDPLGAGWNRIVIKINQHRYGHTVVGV